MARRAAAKRTNGAPAVAQERRLSPRRKTRFKATLVFGRERSTVPCIVRDMSETGARLETDRPEGIPGDFYLIWVADRAVLEVEAVWRSRNEIGVRFRSKQSLEGVISNEIAAVMRASEQWRRAGVQGPSGK